MMTTSAAALKSQFDFHTRLFNNVLEGITEAESSKRNAEQINHIKWVAGHIVNTRIGSLSKLAGIEPDESYAVQFARGSSLDPNASYPPLEEIKSRLNETSTAISDHIAKIPEEVLAAKSNAAVPIADDTVRGLLAFLMSHEALHIGQLSLLRKMAGKEAMSFR